MIEEIFIILNNEVLIGDISLYPKNPLYPTHVCNNKQLTQLKCNNIILAILYSNIDVFIVNSYLNIIKNNLEQKICILNAKNISDNYFLVREIISEKMICENKIQNKLPTLSTNEIFIDVIETYNGVLGKNYSTCQIYGYCFLKPRFNEENFLKLIIQNNKNINFLSDYKITERFNKLELELDVYDKDIQCLKYKTSGKLPFKFEPIKDGYVLETEDIFFDFLEVHIPISSNNYNINVETSKGAAQISEECDELRWIFKKQKIGKGVLKVIRKDLSDKKYRNIYFKFKISRTNINILNIEKAVCIDNQYVNIWIRYDACNSKIEFREY
ncbi:AP-2 complex subunit mu [Vairimorpha necatrix]|uniref:AP-2 complex subunit mu n=1 Tax=Vairimorpha necatrix TaxID=6039 RepID=A0AAX4JCT5_9MICR